MRGGPYNTFSHANQYFQATQEFLPNHPHRGRGGPGTPDPHHPSFPVGDQSHRKEPHSPGGHLAAGPRPESLLQIRALRDHLCRRPVVFLHHYGFQTVEATVGYDIGWASMLSELKLVCELGESGIERVSDFGGPMEDFID